MSETSIEWTAGPDGSPGKTWNPVRGCSRISPGCQNCYAERIAARFSDPGMAFEGYALRTPSGGRWTGKVSFLDAKKLAEPLTWKKPVRCFVNSTSDLFHEELLNEEIAAVFGVMAACPQITFQVLTKRADRMESWAAWVEQEEGARRLGLLIQHAQSAVSHPTLRQADTLLRVPWPLPNVWLGVSVEDQQRADERIPHLIRTPAAIRFLSVEPLIGPVDLDDDSQATFCHWAGKVVPGECEHGLGCRPRTFADAVDWVIVGGESGPGARPCDLDWIRRVHGACDEAGTHIFIKQLGARPYDSGNEMGECECPQWMESCESPTHPTGLLHLRNRKGGDMAEWPEDLRVREFPEARP